MSQDVHVIADFKSANSMLLEDTVLRMAHVGSQNALMMNHCLQKDVAVKIMKIKPGAKQESLTELPYTEAAIAGICIHANIVQTMYSDLMPVLDSSSQQEGGGSFWSNRGGNDRPSRSLARSDSSIKEWQVRMVMEICDLGTLLLPVDASSLQSLPS